MNKTIRLILNIIMAGAVVGAWIHMFFAGGGVLSGEGLSNLRYYTVLSNILEGIASIIWVVALTAAKAKAVSLPRWVEILKYIAAVSVFLTFTIVALFFVPLYGHAMLYQGANLWFHLIIPVLAVVEMLVLSDYKVTARDNRLALYPTILYGVVYTSNNLINGIGDWPDGNDWYGFLLWGYPVGILIFVCIGVATWCLGRLIRAGNNRIRLKKLKRE